MTDKTDTKQFIACNKCKSSLLEERRFTRFIKDEWAPGGKTYHFVETPWCTGCNLPVLITEPKSLLARFLLEELVGAGIELTSLLATEVEIDLTPMNTQKPKTLKGRMGLS